MTEFLLLSLKMPLSDSQAVPKLDFVHFPLGSEVEYHGSKAFTKPSRGHPKPIRGC